MRFLATCAVLLAFGCAAAAIVDIRQNSSAQPDLRSNLIDLQHSQFPIPSPEPALPADADRFDPPLPQPDVSAPAIAEISRTADHGEVLSMTGVQLGGDTQLKIFAQSPGASQGNILSAKPLLADDTAATLLLPTALPPWSMYLIWPERGGLSGPVVAVNRTEAWWIGPEKAAPKSVVSVYGRNLSHANGTTLSYIYVKPAAGPGQYVDPISVNPFKVDFRLPDLPPANYEIWIHNGHGGHFGWSGPLKLQVLGRSPWDDQRRKIINVKTFGAVGDGVADETTTIQRALAEASAAAPATLYFPAGTYRVVSPLEAPANVSWLGDGMDASEVRLDRSLATSFIVAKGDNLRFQGMTLNANRKTGSNPLLWLAETKDVKIEAVRLNAWGAAVLDAKNAAGLFIHASELIENGSFYGSSRQVFLSDNRFRMTGYGESVAALWGGSDFSMIGNSLTNADEQREDGHGIGRFFVGQAHFGSMRNLYWQDNVSNNAAPHDCSKVDCNKGEQICFEIVGSKLKNDFVAASANIVEFRSLADIDNPGPGGRDLVIIAGRGAGQHRHIVSKTATAVTLDAPWNVIPDGTSRFALAAIASRAAIYHNSFDGRSSYMEHDSDSTGVLLYGNVYDTVVDSNQVSRMRHGLMTIALDSTDGLSPYFLQYSNNRVSRSSNGLYVGTTFANSGVAGVWGGLGNVYRKNTFEDINHIGVAYETWDFSGGDYDGTVFDQNTFKDLPYGFVDAYKLMWTHDGRFGTAPGEHSRKLNTVLYRNDFDRGAGRFTDSQGFVSLHPSNTWLNIGSTWKNFAEGNQGPLSSAAADR